MIQAAALCALIVSPALGEAESPESMNTSLRNRGSGLRERSDQDDRAVIANGTTTTSRPIRRATGTSRKTAKGKKLKDHRRPFHDRAALEPIAVLQCRGRVRPPGSPSSLFDGGALGP